MNQVERVTERALRQQRELDAMFDGITELRAWLRVQGSTVQVADVLARLSEIEQRAVDIEIPL
jgi:hypothetical protein